MGSVSLPGEEAIVQLLLAILLGGSIGLERESRGRPACGPIISCASGRPSS